MVIWLALGVALIVLGTVALQVLGAWMGGGREAVSRQLPQVGLIGLLCTAMGLAAFLSVTDVRLAGLLAGAASLLVLAWVALRGILSARIVLPVAALIVLLVILALIRW